MRITSTSPNYVDGLKERERQVWGYTFGSGRRSIAVISFQRENNGKQIYIAQKKKKKEEGHMFAK